MTTLEVATITVACPLRKAPFEIMEMIFGRLNFPDLRAVIFISKWIEVSRHSHYVQVVIYSLLFSFQNIRVKSVYSNTITQVWCLGSLNKCLSILCRIGLCTMFCTLSPINFATRFPSSPLSLFFFFLEVFAYLFSVGTSDAAFYGSTYHPRNCVVIVPKISSIPM